MPYIKQCDRDLFNDRLSRYMELYKGAVTPGELNYIFTVIINKYFRDKDSNYQAINDIIGALEGAKLEFYRRTAAPYEDKKIIENGDVK